MTDLEEYELKKKAEEHKYNYALNFHNKMDNLAIKRQWISEENIAIWDRAIIVIRDYRRNSLEFILGH